MKRGGTRWRTRLALAATSLAVCIGVVGLSTLARSQSAAAGPAARPVCKLVIGSSERAADAVVEQFLRTAVVRPPASRPRSCPSPRLSVPALVHPTYETRFPRRIAAWFQLAPKIRNARGLWEYAGFLHVSAPDAAPAAFQFLLELHDTRWLVSSFEVAPGSAEVDPSKAPT